MAMEYRRLGRTGLQVSVLGLGTGGPSMLGQRSGVPLKQAERTVHRALEAMGMRTGVRATTELQALGLHQRSSREYMPKLRSMGVKGAVVDRDKPFGDYRAGHEEV